MQSDTLEIAIAALEQKIRDVEVDIGKAQSEVERAQAEGIDEDVRFWRAEKLQLRTKKKQLRDEQARREVLQQGTALQGYSRLTVAGQAALPDQNFYVDAVNRQDIGKQLLGKRTLMFLGVRQSGKSTDAMALGRKLGMFGYEVAYVCIGPKAANKGFDTEMVWAEVLQRLGIERQQGLASLSILCSLPESKEKGIVLIFDEVTALTGHAGALDIILQEIRGLQYSTRVQGIVLIGVPTLPLYIMAATSDFRWSSFTVDSTRTSQTFTQEDVVDLLEQMAGHLKVQLEHQASLWALVIMAATNGLKGLSGAVLMRVETNWIHGQHYQLPDLTRDLSRVGSARDLLLTGMTVAYRTMSWAIDADNPECQEILQDVTLAGCHIPSGKLCKAAISLIRDGVVKPVALEDGRTALQLAAPLLEQELQGRVLASWQGKAYEDLTDPPLEGGRSLGIYLLESALHWLDLDRLLQEKVEKAGGQILEYAFQHEMSRGLSQVLSSKPQLTSKQWRLRVDVCQRDHSFTAEQQLAVAIACATERASTDAESMHQERSPVSAQKQQAVDYFSAHATMPLASFEPDEPVESLVEEAVQTIVVDRLLRTFSQGQLDKRRLGICVGSYGFELMSGGSRAQVEEHAARSLAYAKLHGLELVFAVHFIVQRATTRQQPVTFPTWPAIPKADEQVIPVDVLVEEEPKQVTAMYHLPEGMQTRIIELQGPPSMDDAIKFTAPSRGPMKIRAVLEPASQVLWPPQQATLGMHLLKPAVQLGKRWARPIPAHMPARHAGWSMQRVSKLR